MFTDEQRHGEKRHAAIRGASVSGSQSLRLPNRLRRRLVIDEVRLVSAVLPRQGQMVDVGAHAGASTIPYASAGWNVLAFEPDPANRAQLQHLVAAGELPVMVDGRAVSDVGGIQLPLYRSDVSTGITALSSFHDSHRADGTVMTVTLAQALGERGITDVDFLKVDTEGHDLFVLEGFPWDSITPSVVMCEFEDRKTVPLGHDWVTMAEYLVARGYEVLVSEWHPVVEYGRKHMWRCVRRYPCQLATQDAWGNLVGVRDRKAATRLLRRFHRRARLGRLASRAT